MYKKILIVSMFCFAILGVGAGVYYFYLMTPSVESKQFAIDTKDWKTYKSKWGFSVSYPKDWILEEVVDIEPSEAEMQGYKTFNIFNYKADNPKNEPGISINFSANNEITYHAPESLWPKDPKQRILFIAKKNNIYTGKWYDKRAILHLSKGLDILLIYYGRTRLVDAFFVIPNKRTLVTFTLESEHGEREFLFVIKSIKLIK